VGKEWQVTLLSMADGKEIVKELADACYRRKFSLCLYFSIVDWPTGDGCRSRCIPHASE